MARIEPTDADIGRRVVYMRHPRAYPECGELVRLIKDCAFVRYDGKLTTELTRLSDLAWEEDDGDQE